jgi:hypothetical protein
MRQYSEGEPGSDKKNWHLEPQWILKTTEGEMFCGHKTLNQADTARRHMYISN